MSDTNNSALPFENSSRDRVLAAAHHLIENRGYIDFSMRELAKVSGLAKATIYHHFSDKQAICNAVIEYEFTDLRDRIVYASQSADDPVERLRAVVNELLGPELERRLLVVLATQETTIYGLQVQELIKRYRVEIVTPIADIFNDGIRRGTFRPLNVDIAVIALLGTMHSYITHRLLVGPDDLFENIAEHTIDILLHGVCRGECH